MMVIGSVSFDTSTSISAQKDALESAARLIDYHLSIDSNLTGFIETLKSSAPDIPTISGFHDHDYPGINELGIDVQELSQLSLMKRTPIPSELFEQFRLIQGSCIMGLFPEIGRAWLLIDSNIFIWSFEDGSDLAYYDGMKETIICVGLAKPKPGVFQDFIHYILCLATPVEIVLLGVSFSQTRTDSSPLKEMHLLPEPLFSFSADNTLMSTFASTDNGRIFLGGQDGCLYELKYWATEGWFSKKRCEKTNHSSGFFSSVFSSLTQLIMESDSIAQIVVDDSRHMLYARTDKGSIQVFYLGADGDRMSKVTFLNYQAIWNIAANAAKTIDKKYFYPVVHICSVEASESHDVHLIAILQSGVRLFFTTFSCSGDIEPSTLKLLHLRLPPGFSANSAMSRLDRVHVSYYKKGFSLFIAKMSEHYDLILTTSDDLFVYSNILVESHASFRLDSHLWAVSEIPSKCQLGLKSGDSKHPSIDPPLLLTQHFESPRRFLFLSNQGCSIFTKPKPVDILAKLLLENRGPICDAVKSFFKLHREIQVCAMCLILCCNKNPQDKQVAQYASQAFFHYGGTPSIVQHQMDQIINPVETSLSHAPQPALSRPTVWASTPTQHDQSFPSPFPMSTVCSPVKSVFTATKQTVQSQSPVGQYPSEARQFSPGSSFVAPNQTIGYPQQSPLATIDTSRISSEVLYSAKHDGLYIYFTRIMRSLWNMKLVSEQQATYENVTTLYLTSNITSEDLTCFLLHLGALKDFISQNLSRFVSTVQTSSVPVYPARQIQSPHLVHEASSIQMLAAQKKTQSEAELQERKSITNLHNLITYTHELLGLWKVLCDHRFESVIAFLAPEYREQLKQMMFRDFIEVHDLAGCLASTIVNFYLDDNASTISISKKLREVCPSIYRIEDATVSEVFEIVKHTKSILNPNERAERLRDALKLCKEVCPNFDLQAITNLFQEVKFYDGIVDICLCTAQRLDPQNLGLHYYKNEEPPTDQQGLQAYTNRMNCYKTVMNVLNTLWQLRVPSNQCPPSPIYPGEQSTSRTPTMFADEAKTDSENLFEMVLSTADELFHSAIYDWLFDNEQTDALLNISSHFLESYLKRRCNMNPDNIKSFDLLWKFYEKTQNFTAAAKVLSLLADKQDPNLLISDRVQYLSRAILCVKSSEVRFAGGGGGEFLHELEEKMEVVRIQLQILEALRLKNIPGIQPSLERLNFNFMDITQLFEEFAVRYNLPESQLAILQCAGHYDPNMIESLWQNIINNELEATCGQPADVRTDALKQKIQSLSQIYMNSEKYFPIASIVKYLELKTCNLNFPTEWVCQTMLSIGLNIGDVWSVYHKFYRSKENCFRLLKKPLHLLQVLSYMINEFASVPSMLPQGERRVFITLCLDAISSYLVDLQAMSLSDYGVNVLIKEFKSIQPKLERMLL